MSTVRADHFYEKLTELFYDRLFEFARKRVNGSVNREYSADDVVGTTLRTLLRRNIHGCPRLREGSGDSTRIGLDDSSQPQKLKSQHDLNPIFVIQENEGRFFVIGSTPNSVELNSVIQEAESVPLKFGDKFRVAGVDREFLFANPHLPDELWPLLVTIAARKIAKVQRRKFSHLFVNESALESTGEFALLAQLDNSTDSQKEMIAQELRSEAIRNGFRKVAEVAPERLLFTLEMRLKGMSNQEIADELCLSVSRVKQLLKKIRDIIVKTMDETFEGV